MDSRIYEALGHSIFYEEWKGDLLRAREIADKNLAGARRANDAAALADALIDCGVAGLLQGEIAYARDCFAEAQLVGQADADRRLRALSYQTLAIFEQFDSFPDGGEADTIESESRRDEVLNLASVKERWLGLMKEAARPPVKTEALLIYGFLCNLKTWCSALAESREMPQEIREALSSRHTSILARIAADPHGSASLGGFANLCLADLWRRSGDPERARQFLDRARLNYQAAGDSAGLAACALAEGDWEIAPTGAPLTWNFELKEDPSPTTRPTDQAAAFASPSPRAIAAAQAAYAEAERLFAQAGARRGCAATQLRYGYLRVLEDDFPSAARAAERARELFECCGDGRGYFLALAHLALLHIAASREAEARQLAQAIGDWGAGRGSFSFSLGLGLLLDNFAHHCLVSKGDYERALIGYRVAQSLFTALGAAISAARSAANLGQVYEVIGERAAAAAALERALDLYQRISNTPPQQPATLKQRKRANELRCRAIMLAMELLQLHRQRKSADGLERDAAILKEQLALLPGAGEGVIPASAEIAAQAARGGLNPAKEQLVESLLNASYSLVRRKAQDEIEIASVLVPAYRAVEAKEAGQAERAAQLLAEATTALESVSEHLRPILAAFLLSQINQYAQAVGAMQRFVELGGGYAWFDPAFLQPLLTPEIESSNAADRQKNRHELELRMKLLMRDYAAAEEHLKSLERLAGADWWAREDYPWQPLGAYGRVHEGLNRLPMALEYYDRAIEQFEVRRRRLSRDELKTAFAAEQGAQDLYLPAARAAMKQGDHARAFDYAERGKARALLDLMAGRAAGALAPAAETAAMREWRRLSAKLTVWRGLLAAEYRQANPDAGRLAQLARQIEADEAQLQAVEAGLARSDPNFYQAVSVEAGTLSLEQVAAKLPPGAALIEYFFLGEDLLAWAVTRDGLAHAHHVNVDATRLAQRIREFHRACAARAPVEPVASQLAEVFLAPFAFVIRRAARIIVAPYSAAHSLPFHALPFDGDPLIAAKPVSYLPSASALQFAGSDTLGRAVDHILAVGNPTGDLRHAETEAAFVASLFKQAPLLGDQATAAAVRERLADCPPLLHFATHGHLFEDAPLRSSISLANGEELTVYDLMGLQLKTELVVLSACDTAQGETTGGDDVLGLTRGLLGAGARAAVVSLWPVDDLSTSLLMGEFYRQLRAGAGPKVALQAAQNYLRELDQAGAAEELRKLKATLQAVNAEAAPAGSARRKARFGKQAGALAKPAQDYHHPHFWAPFVLVG